MKKTLLILLLSAMYVTGNAQSKARRTASYSNSANKGIFSLGLEAGLPVGDNGKVYSSILGGSLQYEIKPDADLGITFSVGYLNYHLKSSYGGGSVGFVPLLAGVKYYFTPRVFLHPQLGAAIGTASKQGTSFAYALGLGYKLSRNVDAEIKYMGLSRKAGSLDDVGVRLAYNF
jgi:opacity protein-like surface antigen